GSGVKITKPGTIGPVVEGVELKILNPDPKTNIGEVIVKGPNVMKGYYKAPELTQEVFTTKEDSVGEGWFKTGDLGELDKTGRLSLKGRLKNMILGSSGENIYPEDIEFVLNQHPLVTESLVVEGQKGLVALVQLDDEKYQLASEEVIKKDKESGKYTEKRKALLGSLGQITKEIGEDLIYAQESILNEIQFFVNKQVNRFSQIGKVQKIEIFEKTASQKIKRYLYNLKKGNETSFDKK
ncbi:MAG: AMP-binding protein, partial [Spirochaetaceae bacterium]|nr:AMP-binding protein [Spirochaetaceae bacterium]